MDDGRSSHDKWARFRFAVIGPLLSAPPPTGELRAALAALSAKVYRHPLSGEPLRLSLQTIERWYYESRASDDPVSALRRKVRRDAGTRRSVSEALEAAIKQQYSDHPRWTYQLHYDNLAALCRQDEALGPLPSYTTVRRFMKARGLLRLRRRADVKRAKALREVRSFEVSHVHGLWHADFHSGSRRVLRADATRVTPKLLAVLDDRSRLCCHAQWYLSETVEAWLHALEQAIVKRGLPRALMTDNGSAFIAAESLQGLARLGIRHAPTLVESPYMNGKQEAFFNPVERRLMAMLEGVAELSLAQLNEATQAWVELEHNRELHRELGQSPLSRFLQGPDVGRPSPSLDALRQALAQQISRKQRRSDGTISVDGVRFELPGRYRHLARVTVRYRSFDKRVIWLVDARRDTILCPLYPLDRERNADGRRRYRDPLAPSDEPPSSSIAPYLAELLAEYAETGLPPAYLPFDETPPSQDDNHET